MNRASRILWDRVEDDDPTVEMELTPAQLEILTRAAESEPAVHPPPRAVPPVAEQAPPLIEAPAPSAASVRPGASRLAIGLGIVGVCAFSASVAYLTAPSPATTTPPAETVPGPARPAEQRPPGAESPQPTPVFFVNPFDATEIFEFPPGTSETEARDAVADALLKRARERLNLSSDANEPPGRSGHPDARAARSRLARRG